MECQQHIGEDTVRAVSMDSTDGLKRGVEVLATGAPIKMPAGEEHQGSGHSTLLAMPLMAWTILTRENGLPIHREAPKFEDLSTSTEVMTYTQVSKSLTLLNLTCKRW